MRPVKMDSEFALEWYTNAPITKLKNLYDPNQMWLPFEGQYFAFQAFVEEPPPPLVPGAAKSQIAALLSRRDRQRNSHMPSHGQLNFDDPTFHSQFLMPYDESYLRLSNNELKKVKTELRKMVRAAEKKGVPIDVTKFTWDLLPDLSLHTIAVDSGDDRDTVIEWCDRCCKRRYNYSGHLLTFESKYDAVMAKMRFR
jgi:hypothetical protein